MASVDKIEKKEAAPHWEESSRDKRSDSRYLLKEDRRHVAGNSG